MNYRDRIATQSDDEGAGDLASFVSEDAIAGTFELEQPEDALWQFPEEGSPSAAATPSETARRKPSIYACASLVAAIFVGAIVWWGGLIPRSRPVVTGAIAEAVVMEPVKPPTDVSSLSQAQLIPSLEVRPSARPPMASIVPTVARETAGRLTSPPPKLVALSGAAPERRRPLAPATSMARGTSGGAPEAPIRTLGSRTATDPVTTAPMVVANPAVRSPAPEPPLALEGTPAASLSSSGITAAAVRPEPEALPSVVARTEQSEIQRTLGQYRSAYQLLDAEAARAVWPSVDVRALARAFDTLTSQQLAFESCQFDIEGEAATAQCRGSATYTPKVGSRGPRLEPRQWTFHLRKVDEGWKIQRAQTRR
jgi:hypothetical protein